MGKLYEKSLDKEQWLLVFKAEFRRRTGISIEDAGMDNEQAQQYWPQTAPLEAVFHQIEKYNLTDLTDSW